MGWLEELKNSRIEEKERPPLTRSSALRGPSGAFFFNASIQHSSIRLLLRQAFPHILPIDPSELPQQLLRALVEHRREHETDLDDEVAATAGLARRRRAALAQAEPLPRRRPWRD